MGKAPSPFRYFHSSPEVIRLVVMLYVRFPLSLRNAEDLLAARGTGDRRRSSPTASDLTLQRCGIWAIWIAARWAAGRTIVPEIRICHSGDENGRCSDLTALAFGSAKEVVAESAARSAASVTQRPLGLQRGGGRS